MKIYILLNCDSSQRDRRSKVVVQQLANFSKFIEIFLVIESIRQHDHA